MIQQSNGPALDTLWRTLPFTGYQRKDGKKGIRNLVVVMAAADNVNPLARHIAAAVPGALCLPATFGRGQLGEDLALTLRTMQGLAQHPNVFFTLVVSFEAASSLRIVDGVCAERKQDVAWLSILDEGGITAATRKAVSLLTPKLLEAGQQERTPLSAAEITLGLECGGSDTSSGIVANPCLGLISDSLLHSGGTAIFSEPVECLGCSHLLAPRARTSLVASQISELIQTYDAIARSQGIDLTGINPTADNIAGGLSSIEEKALGAISKSGSMPIEGVIAYGEHPKKPGLWLMDAPAPAVENLTALAAGGCQMILFATGSCNPVGNPVSPTMKVCANPLSTVRMHEHIDVDLSSFFTQSASLPTLAENILRFLSDIACGKQTAAERTGFLEHTISRIGRSV